MKKMILATLIFASIAILTSSVIMRHPSGNMQSIARWEHAKLYTKDYLDSMPAAYYDFRATPEMRTFAQQYLHIAEINFRHIAAATGMENPFPGDTLEHMPDMQSKSAVTEVVMRSYDMVMEGLKKLSDDEMSEMVKIYGKEISRDDVIFKAYENQMHHRGQTTVYMRLKGLKPPPEK